MTWEALEKAGADLLRTRGPAALRTAVEYAKEARPPGGDPAGCAVREPPCSTRSPTSIALRAWPT